MKYNNKGKQFIKTKNKVQNHETETLNLVRVSPFYAQNPLPLLRPGDVEDYASLKDHFTEGNLLHLVDPDGKKVGTAYYGIQHKAIGWYVGKSHQIELNDEYFVHKFTNAFSKRLPLLNNNKTNVFRMFNGEGDGIGGLTLDYYDENILISYYSLGIYKYREEIRKALKRTAACNSIVEKKRFGDNQDGILVYGHCPQDLMVEENNVKCSVDLINGGMTGIFADQREVRKAIRNKYAKNKHVLNMFSYTALFSVFAALGGARSTTSVDLAPRSHELAKKNFELNHIHLTEDPEKHLFFTDDVFEFVDKSIKKQRKYDLIIIDPPSFSTSSKGVFNTEKGLKNLLRESLNIAHKKTIFIISINNAKVSLEKFRHLVSEQLQIMEEYTQPFDYRPAKNLPESSYLKVAICSLKSGTH